jgi:hypothetical protein
VHRSLTRQGGTSVPYPIKEIQILSVSVKVPLGSGSLYVYGTTNAARMPYCHVSDAQPAPVQPPAQNMGERAKDLFLFLNRNTSRGIKRATCKVVRRIVV